MCYVASYLHSSGQMLLVALIIAGSILVYLLLRPGKKGRHLPPGPPTYPIIGIIPSLPLHIQFTKWAKLYGDVYTVKVGSVTMIVMSSVEAVRHIIEKNTALTSDRPANYFADLVSEYQPQPFILFTGYSELWRNQRRAVHEILRAQTCLIRYMHIQKAEIYQLAIELLKDPEAFANHTRRLHFSSIMNVVYGIRIPSSSSDIYIKFYDFMKGWGSILVPGAQTPVDAFPILKFVPEILDPWKKLGKKLSRQEKDLYFGFFERVEKRVERGEGNGCFAEMLLEKGATWGLDRIRINYLCRALVEAGADTSNAAVQTFLLMMVAFPDEMKKAQLEIDSVIGTDRMPVLEDIDELPYVRAVILEALRLRPVAPIGVPHATSGVVNYNNYLIPEGATLVMNIWGIFHDENLFPDADVYNPERFINNPDGAKVVEYLFGAGRRVCPGNNFAKNSLHLTVMTLLWGFNIRSVGKVDLDAYQEGITTEPKPFKCDIKPRSAKHAEMILAEYQVTRRDVMHFEGDFSENDKAYIRSLS
ncbi:cytochrome P450 [Cyathus striatus]|nr:cytochrome P450 [Cyathus striatus]